MKSVKNVLLVLAIVFGVGMVFTPHDAAFAINVIKDGCAGSTSAVCASTTDTVNPIVGKVVNILLFILGAIAVIMIIVGGFMYTTSGGDAGGIKKAKDTIMYAIIGLIVALLAFAIVNFVAKSFGA